jgi:YVTN family beta-propeller protein
VTVLELAVVLAWPVAISGWQVVIDDGAKREDHGSVVAIDPSGDVLTAGRIEYRGESAATPFPDRRFAAFKLDGKGGGALWRYEINEGHHPGLYDRDGVTAIVVTPEGNVIVGGTSELMEGRSAVVVKLDGRSGAELWRQTIPPRATDPPNGNACVSALALDTDGNVLAAAPLSRELTVSKLDGRTGRSLWQDSSNGGPSNCEFFPPWEVLRTTTSGKVLLVTGGLDGFFVMQLSGSTGELVWRYASRTGSDRAAIALDSTGSIVVGSDLKVVKLAPETGAEIWSTGIGDSFSYAGPLRVEVDVADDVVVGRRFDKFDQTGGVTGLGTTVVKLRGHDGEALWRQDFPDEHIADLALDELGNVLLGGEAGSRVLPQADFALWKLANDSGEVLWRKVIDGQEGGIAQSVAVDRMGDVVAVGDVRNDNTCLPDVDYKVVKVRGDSGRITGGEEPTPVSRPACTDHLLYATVATNPWPPITESSPNSIGTLLLLDGQTMEIIATVNTGSRPVQVVAHPTAPLAYVLEEPAHWWADGRPAGRLYVVDAEHLKIQADIAVGFGSRSIAITPDGARVYVANWKSNSLSVVETGRNAVVATIDGIESPVAVAAHPDGGTVYVAGDDGTLTLVSVETDEIQRSFRIGRSANSVAVSADGRFVFVSGDREAHCELIVVSAISGRVEDIISHPTAGDCVGFFAFTNDGRLGVTSSDDFTGPTLLDLQTRKVDYPDCDCRSIDQCYGLESDRPGSVAIWDPGYRAYVAGGYNAYALDLTTRTTVGHISRADAKGYLLSVAVAPCPAALTARGDAGNGGCSIEHSPDRRTLWELPIGVILLAALASTARLRRAYR